MAKELERVHGVDLGLEVEQAAVAVEGLEDELRLSVAAVGDAGDSGSPVIVVAMDADLFFASLVQMASGLQIEGLVPPLIVAGIGYHQLGPIRSDHTALMDYLDRRSRDNLLVSVDMTRLPRTMTSPTGGHAPQLLEAIIDDILPMVRSRFDVGPGPQALVGHSGGGHFGLYAALSRPDVFDRVVAGTPVVYSYDRFETLAAEWATSRPASGTRLFIGTGELETRAYLDDIERLAAHLTDIAPDGAHIVYDSFPGETHNSVSPGVFNRGLRTVLAETQDPSSPPLLDFSSLDEPAENTTSK